jgi:hypothetical protein
LSLVNDKLEGNTNDFGDFGKYIFVSCWTDNSDESLPLWNMYTNKMRGVRIELETPIFDLYKFNDITDCSFFPPDRIKDEEKGIFLIPPLDNRPYYKIDYTDDESKINPDILSKNGLLIFEIGKCKALIWSFENEWRFRFFVFPIDSNKNSNDIVNRYSSMLNQKIKPSIDYYDVRINETIYRNMKIIKGPRLNSGDSEIIEALIKTYNPTAIIDESILKKHIK